MSRKKKARSESSVEVRDTWWERLSERMQHTTCLLLLAAVSFAFFAPIHFGGKSLAGSDTVNWRATAESVLKYEDESGEEALWAPNVFGGMPAYMISYRAVVPQLDTVFSAVRQLIWPSSHFLLLLFGTYALVFFLSRNKWAGVLSAVAFGLTTYIPVLLAAGHNSKFVALCYAPWLLLGFAFAVRRPGLLGSLLFAAILAMHLRAGHFQITYYLLVVMLIWWLAAGISALRKGETGPFGRATLALAVGGILAGLMVAQPYLAQYEYKAFTIRGLAPGGGEGGLAWDYAMGWSQGIGELLTLIVADAYGGSEAYWGGKPFTAGPHYITVVVAFLAVVGATRFPSAIARGLGVAAIVVVLFSLGSNLALVNRPMFEYFPLYDAFRVPETWLAALALVCAVLAGLGVTSLITEPTSLSLRSSRVAQGFAGLAGLLLVMVLSGGLFLDFAKQGERENAIQQIAVGNQVSPDDPRVARAADEFLAEMAAERRDRFSGDAWRSLIALLAAGGIFVLYRRNVLPGYAFQVGLVLIVLFDLWGVDRRYFDESKLSRADDIESAIPEYDFDRYILERKTAETGPFRVLSLEGSPTTTARPSFFHESLSGYHGAKLRLYQDYLEQLMVTPDGQLNSQALRIMNTRFVIARSRIPGTRAVFADDQTGFSVYEVDGFLPRAYFVDSVVVAKTSEEAWELLRDPNLDLDRTAVVDEQLSVPAVHRDSAAAPSAEVRLHTPRRIEIDVATDRKRLLVLSEVYYPAGWTAEIDGAPAEIHRVDYLLRGVVVPAGSGQVVFRFDPSSHRSGLWIAAATTILVYGSIVILIGLRLTRRRSASAEGASD